MKNRKRQEVFLGLIADATTEGACRYQLAHCVRRSPAGGSALGNGSGNRKLSAHTTATDVQPQRRPRACAAWANSFPGRTFPGRTGSIRFEK